MHKLKLILLITAIVLSFLFSVALLVPLKYEDEVKKILVEQLDENLTVALKISSIDLSLFRHFPKASIVVKELELDGSNNHSPLARVDQVNVILNLKGLLSNKYIIERVDVLNAVLNIHIDSLNNGNYDIFKVSEGESKPYELKLDRINLKNLRLNYIDKSSHLYSSTVFDNINLSGTADAQQAAIRLSFSARVDSIQYDSLKIVNSLAVETTGRLAIADNYQSFRFDHFEIGLNQALEFVMQGSYNDAWNLNLSLPDAKIQDVVLLVPGTFLADYDYLSLTGDMSLEADLESNDNKQKMPGLNLKLDLNDAKLSNKLLNTSLKSITFNALLTAENIADTRTYYLDLSNLAASGKKGELTGTIKTRDFRDINSLIKIKSSLSLSTLAAFIPAIDSMNLKGKAVFELGYTGKISELIHKNLQGKHNFSGLLQLDDMEFTPFDGVKIKHSDASLLLSENNVEIKSMHIQTANSDLKMEGKVTKLLEWVMGTDTKMIISGKVTSDNIKLEDFIPEQEEDENQDFSITLPENIESKIQVNCKKLYYEDILAENIKGELLVSDFGIVFNDFSAQLFEGIITANGRIFEEDGEQTSLDGIFDLEDIDITQLFTSTHNFGQDYITNKNLAGRVTGQVNVNSFWNPDLTPDYDKLFAIADISIVQGELNNFEPIDRLFGFIKAKQFKNVKFDRLENSFLIKDKLISIPQMEIRSNVMNLTMAGDYGFDDQINYQFKVNLTDFFFKKNRDFNKNSHKGEEDGRGGINLFVSMTGTSDNPVIKYNKSAVKEQINKGLKKEGKELKNIFDKNRRKKATEEYEFEWDDGK